MPAAVDDGQVRLPWPPRSLDVDDDAPKKREPRSRWHVTTLWLFIPCGRHGRFARAILHPRLQLSTCERCHAARSPKPPEPPPP